MSDKSVPAVKLANRIFIDFQLVNLVAWLEMKLGDKGLSVSSPVTAIIC